MTKDVHNHIIDVVDYRGRRVILTSRKHNEKLATHPELGNRTFLKNLQETIRNPEEVWQDKSDKINRLCYYKKYSSGSYIKAVIWCTSNPCRVVSAYEINRIKETKYPGLKRLK